jgi:hypothetical protein
MPEAVFMKLGMVYQGIRARLNGALLKSLPSVFVRACVCVCVCTSMCSPPVVATQLPSEIFVCLNPLLYASCTNITCFIAMERLLKHVLVARNML